MLKTIKSFNKQMFEKTWMIHKKNMVLHRISILSKTLKISHVFLLAKRWKLISFFFSFSHWNHYPWTIRDKNVWMKSVPTFPAASSFWASSTSRRTLAAMQRYLKKRWWDDQNWPQRDFLLTRPRSSAARMNTCKASAHWKENIFHDEVSSHVLVSG